MTPNTQTIRERAYAIWQKAGEPHGSDIDHWLAAESELRMESAGEPAQAKRSRAARKRPARTKKTF